MIPWIHKDKLDAKLVSEMNAYDEYLKSVWSGSQIVVHDDYEVDGHVADSQHYSGRAVDFHVQGVSLFDAWLAAERFGFTGIGVYPHWNHPGLHCDTRPAAFRARWFRDAAGGYLAVGAHEVRQISGEL